VVDSRIDELRRRLERDPGSRLFAQLAEEYRKAGNHAEAIRVARSGLEHHPAYPSARLTLGRALLESGDPAGARTELESALREAPDNILASRFLGQALEAQGDFKAALERYEATLKLAPGDRQLEAQVRSVQKRMESPRAPVQRPERATTVTLPGAGGASSLEQGSLPPTIRIHMPGDRGGLSPPAPAPPPPLPVAPARAPQVPPPTVPVPAVSPKAPALDTTQELGGPPPAEPGDAGSAPLSAEPFYESDVAPTLPTAQTPEFGASRGRGAPAPGPAPAAAGPGEPIEPEVVEEVPAPPEPAEVAGSEPQIQKGEGGGEGGTTPFSSSTLAELYFRQGLVDRAVEIYHALVAAEPTNAKARARLSEIVASRDAVPVDGPVAGVDEERAARRRALERTIARLEALLLIIRRR
jgi:hypothetical protein